MGTGAKMRQHNIAPQRAHRAHEMCRASRGNVYFTYALRVTLCVDFGYSRSRTGNCIAPGTTTPPLPPKNSNANARIKLQSERACECVCVCACFRVLVCLRMCVERRDSGCNERLAHARVDSHRSHIYVVSLSNVHARLRGLARARHACVVCDDVSGIGWIKYAKGGAQTSDDDAA